MTEVTETSKTKVRQAADSPAPNQTATASRSRSRGRREHILELAAELFASKGVAATTVRDIGDAAGILSGSLYHHFNSKEAMVEEIVSHYLQELTAAYEAVVEAHDGARPRLEGLIRASFTAIDQHSHACEIYQNDYNYLRSLPRLEHLNTMTEAVQHMWLDAIQLGVSQGVFRSDVEPGLFYRFARDAIWFTVRWKRRPQGPEGVKQLSDACITILLDGYVTPRPT